MIKLWGRKNSINVQKVLWALGETGLEFERVDAGMEFGVIGEPWFKEMNPNALVPAIEAGGKHIWESNAIVRYIAAKEGKTLLPDSLEARALADMWMDWKQTSLWPVLRPGFWQLIRTPEAERDSGAVAASLEQTHAALKLVDAWLSDKAYMAGDSFSMGDLPIGIAAFRWFNLPWDVSDRPLPHLDAWYGRITERPAFKEYCDHPLI